MMMVAGAQVLAQAEVDDVDGRSVSGREDCCKPPVSTPSSACLYNQVANVSHSRR